MQVSLTRRAAAAALQGFWLLFAATALPCYVPVAVQDKSDLKEHLQQLAWQCQWLILWLDCHREGENISFEVRGS